MRVERETLGVELYGIQQQLYSSSADVDGVRTGQAHNITPAEGETRGNTGSGSRDVPQHAGAGEEREATE